MTWTPLWSIWIIEFLLPLEDVESTLLDFTTIVCLTFQLLTVIIQSTRNSTKTLKIKRLKLREKTPKHSWEVTDLQEPCMSFQSCLHRLVESNIEVKFGTEQAGTDIPSWSQKITGLSVSFPLLLSLPSHSLSHLWVCAGSCAQTCHEPGNWLTQHKAKLPTRLQSWTNWELKTLLPAARR